MVNLPALLTAYCITESAASVPHLFTLPAIRAAIAAVGSILLCPREHARCGEGTQSCRWWETFRKGGAWAAPCEAHLKSQAPSFPLAGKVGERTRGGARDPEDDWGHPGRVLLVWFELKGRISSSCSR